MYIYIYGSQFCTARVLHHTQGAWFSPGKDRILDVWTIQLQVVVIRPTHTYTVHSPYRPVRAWLSRARWANRVCDYLPGKSSKGHFLSKRKLTVDVCTV